MSGRDYYKDGEWNVTCSMCGRKRKSSEVVKNWQGQWRCPEHNDARHPQDFVRAVPDLQTVPFAQPPSSTFQGYIEALFGGTPDAITINPLSAVGGPFPGQIFQGVAGATNTGSATATLNGQSAVIVDSAGDELTAGAIQLGETYQLQYQWSVYEQEYQWSLGHW